MVIPMADLNALETELTISAVGDNHGYSIGIFKCTETKLTITEKKVNCISYKHGVPVVD